MRKFLFLIMVTLAVTAMAFGSELCVPAPPPAVTVTTGPPSADICSIGGLVFSNFSAVSAGGGASTMVSLVTATVVGQDVYLTFNPGLGAQQDIWFYFTVTGPLGGVDLRLSGVNALSTEVVCSGPLDQSNNCTGTELARIANVSGGATVLASFGQVNTAYIYKDIMAQSGGELSSITESFHVVPEPMTFALIGSGLLGLGLLRRRARKG
jgi:hypothetical protein